MMASECSVHEVTCMAQKKADGELTITQWMEMFKKLYETVDSKRAPLEMWVAATAHFSAVGEAIRRMHFADLVKSASHAFCWMCSFVLACQRAKGTVFYLDESFSSIVTCKYPLVCGHCREAYCHCNPKNIDGTSNKAAKYQELLKHRTRLGTAPNDYSMSRWIDIFDDIYGQHIHMLTLESIGFHFLEEAGEELTSIRGLLQLENILEAKIEGINEEFLGKISTFEGIMEVYGKYVDLKPDPNKRDAEAITARLVHAKVDMFIEFADTFSWFCSILNKVMSIARNCNDDKCAFTKNAFNEELLKEYMSAGNPRCPSCRQCPCNCLFYGRYA